MLNHLAIIMDGNGRWAKARGLPRTIGHRQGAETARATIKACGKAGIHYLTLYAFSSENWNRPVEEVSDLMNLLRHYLEKESERLHGEGIRIKVLGDSSRLNGDIRTQIAALEDLTRNNTRLQLNIALSYGSREEIAHAVKRLARDCLEGRTHLDDINQDMFGGHLYTAGIPDPDLLIRTGGEQRLSNFLLWQSAYTELYFTPTLWPDFNADELARALEDFGKRERRYGNTYARKTAS